MKRAIEKSKFNSTFLEEAMEIQCMISCGVIMLMIDTTTISIVCWTIPDLFDRIGCDVLIFFHGIEQFFTNWQTPTIFSVSDCKGMNQIIMGIATSRLQEGDPLPSVRQLADTVGINMHTVNKAYSLLRQEGFVTIDRRRGAIIAVDVDKIKALEEMKENLLVALAKGCCRNVSRSEVHDLIDEIYDEYEIDN